jgi:hypothetical protein
MTQGGWHLPFLEINQTQDPCKYSFLWEGKWLGKPVYIMDNHRFAAWGWHRALGGGSQDVALLHIDQHYDAQTVRTERKNNRAICDGEIDLYLAALTDDGRNCFVNHANYIGFFNYLHPRTIMRYVLTEQIGAPSSPQQELERRKREPHGRTNDNYHYFWDHPEVDLGTIQDVNQEQLLAGTWSSGIFRWIINLDLDYVFSVQESERLDLEIRLCELIRSIACREEIMVLTIALSPGYCGQWAAAVECCARVVRYLGIEFDADALLAQPQSPVG